MKAKELLLECKVRLGVSSNYKLAKELKLHSGLISDYMNGKRKPDEYACFRIAEALQRDPAEIIAQVNAEEEGTKGDFFRDFILRHGLVGVLVLSLSTSSGSSEAVPLEATSTNGADNDELCKTRRRPRRFLDKTHQNRLRAVFLRSTRGRQHPCGEGRTAAL